MKTYVVTPHLNRLSKTVLMMDHYIRLKEKIWKIIPKLSLLPSYLEHTYISNDWLWTQAALALMDVLGVFTSENSFRMPKTDIKGVLGLPK